MYQGYKCKNESDVIIMNNKNIISNERKKYLRKIKIRKIETLVTQILIIIVFVTLWEILARKEE